MTKVSICACALGQIYIFSKYFDKNLTEKYFLFKKWGRGRKWYCLRLKIFPVEAQWKFLKKSFRARLHAQLRTCATITLFENLILLHYFKILTIFISSISYIGYILEKEIGSIEIQTAVFKIRRWNWYEKTS